MEFDRNGTVSVPLPPGLLAGAFTCVPSCDGAPGSVAASGRSVLVHQGNLNTPALSLTPAEILVGNVTLVADLDGDIGAAALTVVQGQVTLTDQGNGVVAYLFPLLREVSGVLEIKNNVGLQGLHADVGAERAQAFPALRSVGSLIVSGNIGLTNLGSATDAAGEGALPSLTTVSGTLEVAGNATLASLALPSLATVEADVTIRNNDALLRLDLRSLCLIEGTLAVGGNLAATEQNASLDVLIMCSDVDTVFNIVGQTVFQNAAANLGCTEIVPVMCRAVGGSKSLLGSSNEGCGC